MIRPAVEAVPSELVRAAVVAHRFFIEGQTKQEIGRELGISRFKVARLLDLARAEGLVRIEVQTPLDIDVELGRALESTLGLHEAWVVDVADDSGQQLRVHLGRAGAAMLSEAVDGHSVVGISWGRTVRALVDALPMLPSCTTVQIAGGLPGEAADGGSAVVRQLHARTGGPLHLLHAPLFVADAATARKLRAEPTIAATLQTFSQLTIVAVGLGRWDPMASSVASALSDADVAALQRAGVVAEICGSFVDASGKLVGESLIDRALSIRADQLRDVPTSVAIAGGMEKAPAIAAVIRAGLCTHLVTDSRVARALITEA